MTYRIESKDGAVYGDYEGETPEAAWMAMLADAGYDEPEEVTGTIDDWFIEEIVQTG